VGGNPALIDRAAVEAILVKAFIPAAYRRKGRWTATEAEPWLVYLAHHLEHTIVSPDLAWWQLPKKLRRAAPREKRPQEELAVPSRKLRFLPRRLALTILASILLAIFLDGMSLWEQHGKGVKVTPTLIAATIVVAVLVSDGLDSLHGRPRAPCAVPQAALVTDEFPRRRPQPGRAATGRAVYQFRHIKLQRWLADRYEEPLYQSRWQQWPRSRKQGRIR